MLVVLLTAVEPEVVVGTAEAICAKGAVKRLGFLKCCVRRACIGEQSPVRPVGLPLKTLGGPTGLVPTTHSERVGRDLGPYRPDSLCSVCNAQQPRRQSCQRSSGFYVQ
jgi:hypothetical protein